MKIYTIRSFGKKTQSSGPEMRIRNFNIHRCSERDIDELIGICKGIILDREISNTEIDYLADWLKNHCEVADEWPANIISSRIDEVLKDGIVSVEETRQLLELLINISGGVEKMPGQQKAKTMAAAFTEPLPPVFIPGKSFCLTGEFCYGTRSHCESEVVRRSGIIKKNVSQSLDYLVVGTFVSSEWIHTSYGRKIEYAIEIRENTKSNISIIPEEHWVKAIMSYNPAD